MRTDGSSFMRTLTQPFGASSMPGCPADDTADHDRIPDARVADVAEVRDDFVPALSDVRLLYHNPDRQRGDDRDEHHAPDDSLIPAFHCGRLPAEQPCDGPEGVEHKDETAE